MSNLIKMMVTTLVSLLLFSCDFDQVQGKGEVTTKSHELENFNQILVENGWEVMLIPSETPKLIVKANENLLSILEFSVENNALHIFSEKNIGEADAKMIQVYFTDELQKIAARSGADISSDAIFEQEKVTIDASSGAEIHLSLQTNFADVEASSGAEIKLAGTTKNLQTKASSGSEIDAKNLKAKSGTSDASSGAEITLTALEAVSVEASSGGEVNYHGNPKTVSINNSISGNVNKR